MRDTNELSTSMCRIKPKIVDLDIVPNNFDLERMKSWEFLG